MARETPEGEEGARGARRDRGIDSARGAARARAGRARPEAKEGRGQSRH